MANGQINIKFVPQGVDDILKELEKLEKKAKSLQQTLQQASTSGQGNQQATAQLTQMQAAVNSLKSSLDALRASVNTNNQGIQQLGQQASTLQQGMSTATTAIDNATQALKNFQQGAGKTSTAVSNVGKTTQNASSAINEMLTKYFAWDMIISGLQNVISKLQEVGAKALEVSSKVREANRTAYSQLGEAGGNSLARNRSAMAREYGISESDMAQYSTSLMSAGMTDEGDILRTLRASILNARRRGVSINESVDKQKALYSDAMDLGTIIEDIGITDKELLALGIRENADIEKSGNRDKLRRAIYDKELANAGYLDNQTAGESFERIKAEFENLLKEVGDLLLPWVQELSTYLQGALGELKDSPQVINSLKAAFEAIANIIETVLPLLPSFIKELAGDVQVFASAFNLATDVIKTAANTLAGAFYSATSKIQSLTGNADGSRLSSMQSDKYFESARASGVRSNRDLRKLVEGGQTALNSAFDLLAGMMTSTLSQGISGTRPRSSISAAEKGATKARYSVGDAQADKKAAEDAAKAAAAEQKKIADEQAKAQRQAEMERRKHDVEMRKAAREAADKQKKAAEEQRKAAEEQRKAAEEQRKLTEKYQGIIGKQQQSSAENKLQQALEDRQAGRTTGIEAENAVGFARQEILRQRTEAIKQQYAPDLAKATTDQNKQLITQARDTDISTMQRKLQEEWSKQDKEFAKYKTSDEYRKAANEAKHMAAQTKNASTYTMEFANSLMQAKQALQNMQSGIQSPSTGYATTGAGTSYNSSNTTVNINGSPAASQTVSTNAIRQAANQVVQDYERRNAGNKL